MHNKQRPEAEKNNTRTMMALKRSPEVAQLKKTLILTQGAE